MRRTGITLGLGSDSVASNNVVDMFEEMRAAVATPGAGGATVPLESLTTIAYWGNTMSEPGKPAERLQAILRVVRELYEVEGSGEGGPLRVPELVPSYLDELDAALGEAELELRGQVDLRSRRRTVGRLDGRFLGWDADYGFERWSADPSYDAILGPYTAAFNHYVRAELEYANDLPYNVLTDRVHPWSFKDFEGQHVTVAAQQRLGRAHLRAERQLAFGEAVASVFLELGLAVGFLRPAGAEGALVHLAARAEVAGLRILRRPERAGVEAIAAADAQVLRVQHHALLGLVDAVDRADRHARRIGTVHAGDGDRPLAGRAVIDGYDSPPIDAPGHLVLVLARGDAGVALDAALGVAEEFHSRHGRLLMPSPLGKAWSWFPASW